MIEKVKKIILITAVLLLSAFRFAKAQKISIISLNGTNEIVSVLSEPYTDHLSISFQKDTIHLKDVYNVKSIKVLNKQFLKIDYTSRGGSGIHLEHALIVCIHNKMLCEPLHITSLMHEEFIDFRKEHKGVATPDIISDYKVGVNISGTSYPDYKLNGNISDWRKSSENSHDNYNKQNTFVLNFDTVNNVFYNTYANLSQYFTIYDPKVGEEKKQYLLGTFPEVKLGDDIYYYIKNEWYERGGEDDLSKYSYR